MKKIFIDETTGRKRVQTINDQPSLADNSFSKECDANFIIDKFRKTGQINHLSRTKGQYLDLTGVQDLLGTLNTIAQAQAAFDSLPAIVRKKFDNRMERMVAFVSDERNRKEAEELGLIDPDKIQIITQLQDNNKKTNEDEEQNRTNRLPNKRLVNKPKGRVSHSNQDILDED